MLTRLVDQVMSWFRGQSRLTREYVAPSEPPKEPPVFYELLVQHDDDLEAAKARVAQLKAQYDELTRRGTAS